MGPGCAFLDYDQDGWMDVYLVNSGSSDFYSPDKPVRNGLYRNNGDGTFQDVTEETGTGGGVFGMGVASADYDRNGFPDLFVTAYGRTLLYRNLGGRFEEVSEAAGVSRYGWTSSAVWFDYDRDGWLDLFVAGYVEFSKEKHVSCGLNPLGRAYYCVPRFFKPVPSLLFRNNGDGTFTETGAHSGIGSHPGKSLGVVAADVNNDGWMDLFVANDTVQDFLFMNRDGKRWEEIGLFAQVGYSQNGQSQSGMGVDAGDFDGDGWLDLFVSNIDHQNYSLFRNNGDESFADEAVTQGVGQATFLLSGWGVKFFDSDNDGDLDLFLANGHPDDMIGEYARDVSYKEPPLLLENRDRRFVDVSSDAGRVFSQPLSSRGLAIGDYNNDGCLDVLLANNGEAPVLLANRGSANHWLGLDLRGIKANPQGVGARIRWSAAGVVRTRFKTAGGSYLSSHDPREILGLGSASAVDWVEIQWPQPSGLTERFTGLPVDQYARIEEGKGTPALE